jgi:V/A-type H+-transporting ATPase subunit I
MKKYAFMVYHRDYDAFLETLRDLGVLHVKETNSILDNTELQGLLSERKRVAQVLRGCARLNEQSAKNDKNFHKAPAKDVTKQDGAKLVSRYDALIERKSYLQSEMASLEKDIDYMSRWGKFSYDNIEKLRQAGYEVEFFTCPTSRYEPKWGEEYNAVLVNEFQSVTYFVTVNHIGTVVDIEADRPKMPEMGLKKLEASSAKLAADADSLNKKISLFAADNYESLVKYDNLLENDFELSNTIVQTDKEAGDKLMILEGFVPDEDAPKLEQTLEQGGYYFQELEILDTDRTPIKLKNNKFVKLYEPITRMFALPNYSEFDPTPFFAPFFMLFFGLCFGDGGYGLLVLIACTLLKRKVNPDYKPYLSLFQYLGGAALVVGLTTGAFFGVELGKLAVFADVKDYFVSSDNLMTFSIVIGLVQIVFGKAVAAFKIMSQKGGKYGVAPLAWVIIITSLACALGLPMLSVELPEAVKTVLYVIAGIAVIFALLYNTPGKNIFLNFGTGLWNTYNMASGLLGDTLSYIRLFAIGLTGSILGGVFNTLAVDMTSGMNVVARFIAMALILLIGHSINFALCTISSLVHPIRLIFVEYYKNAEFEGGGTEYKPFKKL